MNPQSQGTISSSPADLPLRRKRGRPRKDEILVQGENTPATPGPDNQQIDEQTVSPTVAVGCDIVGQVVSGVIEGSFDSGYLLKVKVGDTNTHLRGVVFVPGKFIPVSAANDVAPHAKLCKRTDMPIPISNLLIAVPGSVPSSDKIDKQSVNVKEVGPPFQNQGLPSQLKPSAPIVQQDQSVTSRRPLKDNLPVSHSGPSLGGNVMPQKILELGPESQSAPIVPQRELDTFAKQTDLLADFEASLRKVPNTNGKATEQANLVAQSAPAVDVMLSTGAVNRELQIKQQAASSDVEKNQPVTYRPESPKLEQSQTPSFSAAVAVSSEPMEINVTEKHASPNKAAPTELARENFSSHTHSNENPASPAAKITEAELQPSLQTSLPETLSEAKLVAEGSPLQKVIQPASGNSSSATKADSDSTAMTGLPTTLFEIGAVPSETKIVTDRQVLPRITESQFCSSSGAVNNLACNIKGAIPPTGS